MKEERYAIMIGLNEYSENPLEYSVKDVIDLRKSIIDRCRFNEHNIYTITDFKVPVIDQISEACRKISETFISNTDLLLFYFSGHGEYDDEKEKSKLIFSDNTSAYLGDIVDDFTAPLNAKNEYLIIDACHAGKNIYLKSKENQRKKESRLYHDSKEVYFLFAAEQNQKAYQIQGLKNSVYTYYLNQAINNPKNYNEGGFLSMSAIDDFVRDKISSLENVIQIPGSESRSTGYKPFAFLETKPMSANKSKILKATLMKNENKNNEFDLELSVTQENRKILMDGLKALVNADINHYEIKLPDNYHIEKGVFVENELPTEVREDLYKSIIIEAKKQGLWAIGDCFQSEIIKPNRRSTMQSLIYGDPEPTTTYHVFFNMNIITDFIKIYSDKIRNGSVGVLIMFYQTKYGFVIGKGYFKYSWKGTKDGISTLENLILKPYLLRKESIELCKIQIQTSINHMLSLVEKWNEQRNKEIDDFLSNAE